MAIKLKLLRLKNGQIESSLKKALVSGAPERIVAGARREGQTGSFDEPLFYDNVFSKRIALSS